MAFGDMIPRVLTLDLNHVTFSALTEHVDVATATIGLIIRLQSHGTLDRHILVLKTQVGCQEDAANNRVWSSVLKRWKDTFRSSSIWQSAALLRRGL